MSELLEVQLKESKYLVCTACPLGCSLQVVQNGEKFQILGARCKRGYQYGQDEAISPKRIVTTTILIKNGTIRRLPVRTAHPFPLKRIIELVNSLSRIEVEAPIQRGQIIVANCLGEGIDLIATRTVHEKK